LQLCSEYYALEQYRNMSPTKFTWLLIATSLLTLSAQSQAIPAATMAPRIAIFGEGSANTFGYKPDPVHYGNLYGGVIGGYIQARPWLGLEARASFLESANQPGHEEHQRAVFFGPRFTVTRNRFRADGIILGGLSHSDYPAPVPSAYPNGLDTLTASTDPAVEAGGGVDLWLSPRFSWRTGEVMYGHVFGPNEPSGVTFSSGLIWRLFR
jgi:hypothetical protein